MKKIFNFGRKKGQSTSRPFNKVPSYFGVQTPYPIEGYEIRSKDLGKIHKAALLGDVEKVQQLLQLGKSTVNELDKMKRTPLHLACANGYTDLVSLLLEKKCELNLLDDDDRTPLMKAIECRQEECATILLEHGADPNLRDKDDNTILHYVACGRTKFMAEILLKYKVDIEAVNKEGLTPLLLSITTMNTELAEFLLKNGANVNVLDSYKRTALMIAVSMESLGLVTLLLQNNADYTLQDESGWTAYTYAERYGYPLHIYHKQIEKHKEYIEQQKKQFEKELCPPQISCSEKPSDTEFALGASSLDKKAEGSSANDSVSSVSDKPGPDDHLPSRDDELDLDMKHSHENLPGISAKCIAVSTDQSSKDSDSLGQHEEGSSTSDSLSSVSDKPGPDDHLSSTDDELDFDMKHSHEKLLEISAKRIVVSTNQNTKDSDSLGQHEDHTGRNPTAKPSLSSCEIKDAFTNQEEGVKEIEPKLDVIKEFDLTDTDSIEELYLIDTDGVDELKQNLEYKGSSVRIQENFDKRDQEQHSHENLLEISARRVLVSRNQNIKDSISLGQYEGHLRRNSNGKPIQPTLQMKDSFTNQEVGKGDTLKWDSTSTSQIKESHKSSIDMKLQSDFPGKSLPLSQNQLPSKKSEKIPTIIGEPVVGIGPVIDYKVGLQLEKPVPQEECSKDMKLQNDFPGKSLPRHQNQLPPKKSEKIPTIIGEPVVGIGPVIDYKVGLQLEKPVPQEECSKDMKLQNDFPGKSLPRRQNQLPPKKSEKIPTIIGEPVVGIGPVIDYKVGVQLEKPVPQEECSKDMKLQNDFPSKSLPRRQNQLPPKKSEKISTIIGEPVDGIGPVIDYKVGVQLEKPVPQEECSKDMKLQNDFPGKSLPRRQNQLPPKKSEKISTIIGEPVDGIGPVIDYKVGVQLEKPVPQEECSKDMKLQNNFPGKSLPRRQNQLPPKKSEKIPTIIGEPVDGIGPVIDYKVGVQLEKPVPQEECSKDIKLQNDFPGKSLPRRQNQLPPKKSEKIPTIIGEPVDGIGPVIDYKVGVQLEKPVPQEECSKDIKLQNDFPGKSLPRRQNQLPPKKSEKIPTIIGEPVDGIGPVIDYKVGVQLEKPVSQEECSKDRKLQNDFPGKSLPRHQNQLPPKKSEKIPTIIGEPVVGIGPVIDYKVGVQLEKPVPQEECSKDMKLQNDFPGKSLPQSQNQLPPKKSEKIPTIIDEPVVGIGPVIDYKVGLQLEKPVPQEECSKDMKLQNDFPGKSLPQSQNQLPPKKSEKIPTIIDEPVVGIGPVIDYKVGLQLEKPVPQEECSKDMKLQNDFPGKSLPLSQNQLPSKKFEKIPTIIGEPVVGIEPNIDYKIGVQLEKPVPQECSKDVKWQSNYSGKSLPLSQNQLPSTKFENIPSEEDEAEVGFWPVIDYKVGVQLIKPVPQKVYSKDMKLQNDYPGKPVSQNQLESTRFGKIPSKDEAVVGIEPIIDYKIGVQLETPVPQECSKDMNLQSDSPGKSLPLSQNQSPSPKSVNMPSQEDKVAAAGSEPVIDSKEGDHLEKPVSQNQCEPFLDKEKQKEVKKDLKQELKFRGPSELPEASSSLASHLSDSVEKEKDNFLSEGDLKSFPGKREDSLENIFLQNLKVNFPKNVLQFSSNMCSKKSTPQSKNKQKIEHTCSINEENIAYVAKNIKKTNSKSGINERNENSSFGIEMTFSQHKNITSLESDSDLLQSSDPGSYFGVASNNQEKMPELITSRKHKEKTKHIETSFQNSHHNATNSPNEVRHGSHPLPYGDKISKMHLDKELEQDEQRLTNELGMLQAESLTLEKEKIQPKEKLEEKRQKHQQNKTETLEREDSEKTENIRAVKANEQFSVEHGKDEENKIPGEEIPIMSISSEEKLSPVHHILNGNWREKLMQKHRRNSYSLEKFEEKEIKIGENFKKPEDEKWTSEDSSSTTCEKVNSSSSLLDSCDDSTLNETDSDELRLAKNVLNEKNKDKVEMATDALDDLTQTHNTGSPCLQEDHTVLASDLSVKIKKSQWTKHLGKLLEKFSKRSKTESQLEHQKVECDRELYNRDRLEDEKEKREKLQTEIDDPSCISYAIFNQEPQTSKLNLQQEREKLFLLRDQLRDQIDLLSIQLSKAEDENYQLRDSLRKRTLILEETQRELKQTKDKLKELEQYLQKENSNRLFLREESLKERITRIEREIQFLKKLLEDAKKIGTFETVVSDGIQVQFRDCSMTVDADTKKQDHVVEEKNKELVEECIHIRERICIFKNEKAEEEDTIRKLKEDLTDPPPKNPKTSLNILSPYQKILEWKNKQLQKEIDQAKKKLQEYQEQNRQLQQYINDLEDYIQKLKMEHVALEDSIKEQIGKLEKFQKNILLSTLIQDVKRQIEEESSKYIYLELKNRSLHEELFSKKMLQKKHSKFRMKTRQYEGAVNVKFNLELPEVEHSQGEQDELDFKQFLQTPREEKDNFYEQMEQQLQELKDEISKMALSHIKAKATLESYRDQRQDSGIYRSFSDFFLSCLGVRPDQDFELWSYRTHQYL